MNERHERAEEQLAHELAAKRSAREQLKRDLERLEAAAREQPPPVDDDAEERGRRWWWG